MSSSRTFTMLHGAMATWNSNLALLFKRALSTTPVCSRMIKYGSGNPYETSVQRKREVKDPSYPDFEKQECLKWSDWKMLRDIKRRRLNSEYWQHRLKLQDISACRSLPNIVREIALEERLRTPMDSSVNRIRNRCAITSRGRGKLFYWRLSRIVWRDLADHGLLSGAIRAKW